MTNSELIRVQHQIENELQSFRNELNKLSVPNYPSETSQKIIDHLLRKVDKYKDALSKIMADQEGQDEEIIEQSCRKLITKIHNPLIKQDIKFLNWLSKAQTRNVPWSFVHGIEKLAQQIMPKQEVLVYCENQHNYGICWSQSETIAPDPYYVLSLPGLHRINVLWHALIGHELFHPRCAEFINRHNKNVLTNIRNTVTGNYKKFVSDEDPKGLFTESERKDRIGNLTGVIHIAWLRAMEELLSDMACVEIFGPAAILAMKAFSACSPRNDIPEPNNNFYPSWQYRLEIAWEHFIDLKALDPIYSKIDNEKIVETFKAEILSIQELAEKAEGKGSVHQHKFAKIAYDEVEKLIPDAVTFVKKTTSGNISKWYDKEVIDQVPSLVKRLGNGIPPNEIIINVSKSPEEYKTEAATLPAIFLSGWIYETYWQKNFDHEDKVMKYETMSRLILKACEDIEIINRIQQCQS